MPRWLEGVQIWIPFVLSFIGVNLVRSGRLSALAFFALYAIGCTALITVLYATHLPDSVLRGAKMGVAWGLTLMIGLFVPIRKAPRR